MKKVLLFTAIASLFALSCQKEMEPENTAESNVASFAFRASVENFTSSTKANINNDHQLVWAEGDKIGLYVPGWGDNQPFTLKEGMGGSVSGEFTWDNQTNENTFADNASVAYFPWQGTGYGNNKAYDTGSGAIVYFNLAGSYYSYESGKMLTPLVAAVSRTNDEYDPIHFVHAGAAVKVQFTNLPAGAHSIGMTAATQQIYGDYQIAASNFGKANMSLAGDAVPGNKTIWLNFTPAATSREFTFLFPVPALNENEKLSFKIYDKNDVLVWSRSTSSHDALNHGDVLLLAGISVEPYRQLKEVSSWYVHATLDGTNWADYPMSTDGDKSVAVGLEFTTSGEFKVTNGSDWYPAGDNWKVTDGGNKDIVFNNSSHDITVAVNGECPYPSQAHHYTSIKNATELGTTETANCYVITEAGSYKIPVVKGNSSTSAGTVGGVELLWETYNNAESVTPNSVIEAVDWDERTTDYIYFKTPATLKPGNALIAAKDANGDIIWSWHIWIPATSLTDIADGNFYNRRVMDRNLGALNAIPTTASSPVALSTYGLYYQWGRKDPMFTSNWGRSASSDLTYEGYNDAGVSVTIEESIKNPTTFYYDGHEVSKDPTNYCYWESSDNTELWKDSEKTIYDPCPAGYRVPKYESSLAMWHYNVADGWSSDSTNGWFKYGDITFPYTGYASGSSLSYGGIRTVIWSSKYKDAERSYAAYVRHDKTPIYNYNSYYKAYLGSVRCTRIDGVVKPPVDPLTPVAITVDGDMSEWASVTGTETPGNVCREMKVMNDSDSLYFYLKSIPGARGDQLWGENAGYYYIDFDLDDDPDTGDYTEGERGKVEAWMYLYLFGGTSSNPIIVRNPGGSKKGMQITGIVAKGVISNEGDKFIEIELSIPRANLPSMKADDIIRLISWRSKDGTVIEQRYVVL